MSSRFQTDLADAADAIYSRHEQIDFGTEVPHCHERIVDKIRAPLKSMLTKKHLWQ